MLPQDSQLLSRLEPLLLPLASGALPDTLIARPEVLPPLEVLLLLASFVPLPPIMLRASLLPDSYQRVPVSLRLRRQFLAWRDTLMLAPELRLLLLPALP
jgi:hypothetical protein